ncbi:MAG: DUF1624 domain-containing protein [Pseudobdellovibrio sp.]
MNYSKKSKSEVARFDRIDALRGLAIVWMTIFHFCFDLSNFGYLKANFYDDPFWTNQRTCIVSLFLFCAGLGQAVAVSKELSWARFFKRWRQIVGASLLVSAGSYFVFPNSFIYFGILHGIALMLLILRLLTPLTSFFVFIGAAIIGLKFYLNAQMASLIQSSPGLEVLNGRWLNWLGLISRKPITEDYVPLVPWLGVLLIGYFIGQWILKNKRNWVTGELKSNFNWLAVLGRWSLSYYLIHQPVLFGLVYLAKQITG